MFWSQQKTGLRGDKGRKRRTATLLRPPTMMWDDVRQSPIKNLFNLLMFQWLLSILLFLYETLRHCHIWWKREKKDASSFVISDEGLREGFINPSHGLRLLRGKGGEGCPPVLFCPKLMAKKVILGVSLGKTCTNTLILLYLLHIILKGSVLGANTAKQVGGHGGWAGWMVY